MQTVRSADGTAIAYDRYGDGPPLVLVGGAFCDRTAPRTLAEALAARFTVYAYDRRGRGDSGDTQPYTVQREVEDLDAVITAAGGSARVFGHSSGAVLALTAAAWGLPIPRLAVYEPPFIVECTRPRPMDLAARTRELIGAGRTADAVRLFLVEGVQVPVEAAAMIEHDPAWPGMAAVAHTLPYDLEICADYWLPTDLLGKIPAPTLVLGGGNSPEWFHIAMRAVTEAIPDARHVTLEGQDHGAADDVLAPVLTDFLLS
jgi:pimeloyl-ACP methyl ester carboxylesterase